MIDSRRRAHRGRERPSREKFSGSLPQMIGPPSQQPPMPSYRAAHRNTLQNVNTSRVNGNPFIGGGNRDYDSAASSIAGGNHRILDNRSVLSADIERRDSLSYNTTHNPINAPSLTLRSEFPTITKSRQLQLFTTLVTVEVPSSGWSIDQRDLLRIAPVPGYDDSLNPTSPNPQRSFSVSTHRSNGSDWSHALSTPSKPLPPTYPKIPPLCIESQSKLETIEADLKSRDMNWHNLDFQRYVCCCAWHPPIDKASKELTNKVLRFGKLRLYGTIGVSKERKIWQVLGCYLFEEILICIREQRPAGTGTGTSSYLDAGSAKPARYKLKGSILMRKHLKNVDSWKGTFRQ